MAKEEKKAPKLRFNGYTNDWEHVKPKKYLKISKVPGSNGLIAKKLTVKLWGKGVVEKDTTFNGSENTKYFTRKSGQLMYGKLDFLHAAFGIVPQNLNNYESTADSPAFDINDVGDRIFLINYFLRPEFYLKNGEKANGSRKAKRIHEETFLNMPMQAPIKSEQEKIAKTLNSLNNTIQLHERKCEELALIKKALLQKLFPKKDEIKPEVRYKNFSDAWEQRKLGGFLQEYSIKSKIENEYPLLSSTNKGMEYREGRTASESNIGYKILKINDLVLSPQNLWLGNININTLVTGIVSPSYKTLKINNLSLYFLLPQLKTKRMLEKYKQVSVQGASVVRRNLDFTEFMNISLVIPTNKEQEQIGEFFKQLDSLIALHQRKLEKLKQLKKFLLQNMFI